MNWNQIAENWNGQVTKLCNWTIDRLESAADKGGVKATQTDCQQPSVKPCKYAGQEEYHEIRHEGPGGRQVSQSEG
jgi:hypothetical protein